MMGSGEKGEMLDCILVRVDNALNVLEIIKKWLCNCVCLV